MTPVVVTGAAGFIGRALTALLEKNGHHVYRVTRGQSLPAIPEAVCVHLAGSSNPAQVLDENLARTQSQELTKQYRRVVFVSTAHVYGDQQGAPCRENTPLSPGSTYAQLKISLERIFSSPPHAIARLSNVYGPGQSDLNVLSDIVRQLPGDGTVRLKGSAQAIRDYLFIDDAIAGLARLAVSQETGIFNFGTGRGTSVTELISILASQLKIKMPHIESPVSNGRSSLILDSDRALTRLGWSARIFLEEGLKSLLPVARLS
jgi:nucleoside-diphosphate-sugar epimerase